MKKMLLLVVVLALVSPILAMAGDDPMPTLPDYTKAPFTEVTDLGKTTSPDFPEWGILSVVRYATVSKPEPGAQAVVVASDKDGKLKYAEWHQITRSGGYVVYAFMREKDKWVFKGVFRPQTTPPKPDNDNKQKS